MNKSGLILNDMLASLRRLAKVSKAKLGGVACFVVKNGSIVSSGINHNPTGAPMEELVDGELASRPEIIHAEIASLKAAHENNIDISGATLLVTMSPCLSCAKEIKKTGVKEVCYLYDWWDKAALDILKTAGVKVKKLKEER